MNGPQLRVESWPARSNSHHNPFQMLLSNAQEEMGVRIREFSPLKSLWRRADVWHWHWPEGQFGRRSRLSALVRFYALRLLLLRARLTKTHIIWTAHNIQNHDNKNAEVETRFLRIFHRNLAGIHYLSHASQLEVTARYPVLAGKPSVVAPHGHYKDVYGQDETKVRSRELLGLHPDAETLVFCGKIRPYKGVLELISAFSNVSDPRIQLLIAGAADKTDEDNVRIKVATDDRIKCIIRHLSDEEIRTVVSAADIVVLPYRNIMNSGSALLALSLNRPILAPSMGSIQELRDAVGNWLITYEGTLTHEMLSASLASSREISTTTPDLSFCDWSAVAREVVNLYERAR